mmetsp:Transcript_10105/g.35396  ORF Transcript_10105/g.35396 Transcript_10105/m.35396 type:complete len:216 (+) Transcript_10105:4132-4779(+)
MKGRAWPALARKSHTCSRCVMLMMTPSSHHSPALCGSSVWSTLIACCPRTFAGVCAASPGKMPTHRSVVSGPSGPALTVMASKICPGWMPRQPRTSRTSSCRRPPRPVTARRWGLSRRSSTLRPTSGATESAPASGQCCSDITGASASGFSQLPTVGCACAASCPNAVSRQISKTAFCIAAATASGCCPAPTRKIAGGVPQPSTCRQPTRSWRLT